MSDSSHNPTKNLSETVTVYRVDLDRTNALVVKLREVGQRLRDAPSDNARDELARARADWDEAIRE